MSVISRRAMAALAKGIRFDVKVMLLVGLFIFAAAPVFRIDELSKYLGFIGTTGLTILAGLWMFRNDKK